MGENTMKKIVKLLSVLCLIGGFLAACGNKEEENQGVKEPVFTAEAGETLIVGLDDTFVPMGFRDNEGNLTGFDVELAEEAGKRLGLTLKFQPIDWSMKETELNTGKIDVIWNGYAINEERQKKVAFSEPYASSSQIIVVLKDSPIKNLADLKGKTVASQQSSSTVSVLENDSSKIVNTFANEEIVQYPSYNDVFNDLDSKRSDAVAVSEVYARYILKQKGQENYRILEETFGKEEMAVGLRKTDKEWLRKLNATLTAMQKDGTVDAIKTKWFGE